MRTFSPRRRRLETNAFTLIELLVTVVILLFVLVALFEFMGNVEQVWRSTAADPFAEAEDAFETVAGRLAGAALEPYQDYAAAGGAFRTSSSGNSFVPDHLARRSDLAFVCGGASAWLSGRTTAGDCVFFLAPAGYTQTEAHLGLERLLNALGYFVEFGDESDAPSFLSPGVHRWRWRLKEIVQPAESVQIYTQTASLAWVQSVLQAPVSVLAENVIALVILPERAANDAGASLAPAYAYDSRNTGDATTLYQLPSRMRLALAVIDEASAKILAGQSGAQAPSLVPANLFLDSSKMDADLATLDAALTARKINHRILERTILLPAAAWTNSL
jgi:uncharacterized protein (TIGR02599 family)